MTIPSDIVAITSATKYSNTQAWQQHQPTKMAVMSAIE